MKKYLTLLLVVCLLLVGCGDKKEGSSKAKIKTEADTRDAKVILDEALENMQKLESLNMDMDIAYSIQAIKVEMNAKLSKDKNSNIYMKTSGKVLGVTSEMEMYIMKDDNNVTIYSKTDNEEWQFVKSDLADLGDEELAGLDSTINYPNEYKSVEKVESDIEGMSKLKVVVDPSIYGDIYSDSVFDNSEIMDDVIYYVYTKDGYITKMVIDMKYNLSTSEDDEESSEEEIMSYSISVEIKDHNKVDEIKLPEEAKNAKEMTNDSDIDFGFEF